MVAEDCEISKCLEASRRRQSWVSDPGSADPRYTAEIGRRGRKNIAGMHSSLTTSSAPHGLYRTSLAVSLLATEDEGQPRRVRAAPRVYTCMLGSARNCDRRTYLLSSSFDRVRPPYVREDAGCIFPARDVAAVKRGCSIRNLICSLTDRNRPHTESQCQTYARHGVGAVLAEPLHLEDACRAPSRCLRCPGRRGARVCSPWWSRVEADPEHSDEGGGVSYKGCCQNRSGRIRPLRALLASSRRSARVHTRPCPCDVGWIRERRRGGFGADTVWVLHMHKPVSGCGAASTHSDSPSKTRQRLPVRGASSPARDTATRTPSLQSPTALQGCFLAYT